MALPIWAYYMKKLYADKRLGYNDAQVFDLPDDFNPCEASEDDMTEVNDIEDVFE